MCIHIVVDLSSPNEEEECRIKYKRRSKTKINAPGILEATIYTQLSSQMHQIKYKKLTVKLHLPVK
jgi:hypothetical protein